MIDLERLRDMRGLDHSEAYTIMCKMMSGAMSEIQMAAVLASLNHRELQLDEIMGFRDAMMDHCERIDLGESSCMDFCGTGGDGKDTFNISTTSALTLGAMGIPVAKHGNYGVSSNCGSSNVLEALGYKFPRTAEEAKKRFESHGLVFIHAPLFHPAMRHVAPVRRAMGVRTIFNIMGPLSNPAQPSHQVSGTFDLRTQRLYSWSFERMGVEAAVVHGLDGYDEISLTSRTRVFSTRKHFVTLSVADFGTEALEPASLLGAETIEGNAAIIRAVLSGEGPTAHNRVVAANAALALEVWDPECSMDLAFQRVLDFLRSGSAMDYLNTLIES